MGVNNKGLSRTENKNMGIDLIPIKSKPFIQPSHHYKWTGWRTHVRFVEKDDVDTSEFSGWNDGELISEKTCREVANVIEDNRTEFQKTYRRSMDDDINFWRHCGGCTQC